MVQPENLRNETVLYGCLNWGSGHVARSIPLMRQLLEQGNKLVVWCTPEQRLVFVTYNIAATFVEERLFAFRFRGDGRFSREMLRNALAFRRSVIEQRKRTAVLVKAYGITALVSDHCYGLFSSLVPSYFVTHQVQLPPASGWLAQRIHRFWMRRFQTIWVMDTAEKRLAGVLSELQSHCCYIGHYSRFSGLPVGSGGGTVAIISGPEPYAQQLFEQVVSEYGTSEMPLTIVAPRHYGRTVPASVQLISNDWLAADAAILCADYIVSRNGYTTLMDLLAVEKPARLLPTPGQLEQEYLAAVSVLPGVTIG